MYTYAMQSVAEIFSLWGSDAEVARDIGISYPTVSSWKQRGSIPVAYWRPLIRAARRRGHPEVTADLLVDIHAGGAKPLGFSEGEAPYTAPMPSAKAEQQRPAEQSGTGHFSRHKHVRRNNFKSGDEIEDHIRALREEWSLR